MLPWSLLGVLGLAAGLGLGLGLANAPGPQATPIAERTIRTPAGSHTATPSTTGQTATTSPPTTGPTTTTPPPRIGGFLVQSASFVTADDGFVLGVVACPTGTCLALRHTVDRGASWSSVPAPPTTLDGSGTTGVSDVYFADARDGWAYGSNLWVTHDGASSWHRESLGGRLVAMASGAGEVYALVEPCESAPCIGAGHLYRSPIGQDSWSPVPGISGRYEPGSVSLVAEGRAVFVLSAYPSPEILGSPDGIHFAALNSPCPLATVGEPGSYSPGSLAASGPTHVAVACLGGVGAGNQLKQVYRSEDGGHTYQRLPDPPTGGDGAELAMPAPTTLLLGAVSAATTVYRTEPPAGPWTTAFFTGGGISLTDLAFVDPAHGAFVYGAANFTLSILSAPNPPPDLGELYLTDDGGATWHSVHIPL